MPEPRPPTRGRAASPPVEHFVAEPRRSVRLGAALLALVALMAIRVPVGPLPLDTAWSEAMRDGFTPGLERLALWLDALGHASGVIVVLGAITVVLIRARRWMALTAFALAEGASSLLSAALKALLERPRPPAGVLHPLSTSFPSGHTSFAAVTCVSLVLAFTLPGRRRVWWPLAVLGTCAMGWSRTFLHVHWLSDVIAGALLGVSVALLVFAATQLRAAARS